MTQNELYELVAEFGEAYGTALRRDSHVARGIDWPENWLKIGHVIGEERAAHLYAGTPSPTLEEMKFWFSWQVENAMDQQDPGITPTLWLCESKEDDEILAVESWGRFLQTELVFRLRGRYPDETSGIKDLKTLYYFSGDEV